MEEEIRDLPRQVEGLVEGRIISGPRQQTIITYLPTRLPRRADIGTPRSLENLPSAETRLLVAKPT
jgi:hypothetical protein